MIKLLQGDCLELMKDIPNSIVDLVITDIPYGEVNRKSNGLRNLDKGKADIVAFDLKELKEKRDTIVFMNLARKIFISPYWDTLHIILQKVQGLGLDI